MNELQVNIFYSPSLSSKWNMLDSNIELERTEEEKYMNHGIFDDFQIKGL